MRAGLRFLAAAAMVTACGGGTAEDGGEPGRSQIRIAIVTHGQAADPFWSVVANGIRDAARDLGVRAEYQAPTRFDMVRMNELIEAAVASRPSALVVSVPDPAALGGAIRAAVENGIPTLGINAGVDAWKDLGLLGYIGQTEYEAGHGAGERLAGAGVRRALCVNHEVGNISQDERCRGLADALVSSGGSAHVLAVQLADPEDTQQRVQNALAADTAIDGILALGPAAAPPVLAALRASGRAGSIHYGTFDLEPDVLRAIEAGEMLFAIDQQPYLQGYLAVVLMTKYLETGTMPGGGDVIRTGPSFVTRETAARVRQLTEQGIR